MGHLLFSSFYLSNDGRFDIEKDLQPVERKRVRFIDKKSFYFNNHFFCSLLKLPTAHRPTHRFGPISTQFLGRKSTVPFCPLQTGDVFALLFFLTFNSRDKLFAFFTVTAILFFFLTFRDLPTTDILLIFNTDAFPCAGID